MINAQQLSNDHFRQSIITEMLVAQIAESNDENIEAVEK